jgi:xanthine dehydrogenase, molybdenum binding subunit apoprotein (EC 1.17.1.4)
MALDTKEDTKMEFKVVGTRVARPDGIDKVTGRARFGADMSAPGMLVGRVLRSPHAHARIVSIDTSAAKALDGVHAVVTRADFPDLDLDPMLADIRDNCMAGEKALYDGHAVAAVAATSAAVARHALSLIKVEYEVLPHVIDVDEAFTPGAPALHEGRADESVPEGMSPNVMARYSFGRGDVEAGLEKADRVGAADLLHRRHAPGLYRTPCLPGADGARTDRPTCGAAPRASTLVRDTCAGFLGLRQGSCA